jgi:hypothetical protein
VTELHWCERSLRRGESWMCMPRSQSAMAIGMYTVMREGRSEVTRCVEELSGGFLVVRATKRDLQAKLPLPLR